MRKKTKKPMGRAASGEKKKVVYKKAKTTAPAKKVAGKPAKKVLDMSGMTAKQRDAARQAAKNKKK